MWTGKFIYKHGFSLFSFVFLISTPKLNSFLLLVSFIIIINIWDFLAFGLHSNAVLWSNDNAFQGLQSATEWRYWKLFASVKWGKWHTSNHKSVKPGFVKKKKTWGWPTQKPIQQKLPQIDYNLVRIWKLSFQHSGEVRSLVIKNRSSLKLIGCKIFRPAIFEPFVLF